MREERQLGECVPDRIMVPEGWETVPSHLKKRGFGVVYVIGAADRGKTTFSRWLVGQLSPGAMTGFLDCDIGQSTIGPPATVGLALYHGDAGVPVATRLRFVGAVTPSGHMVQELVGALRLKEKAREEKVSFLVIDSPGWVVEPSAQEFHVRMIDLLAPDIVVAIQRGEELEGILVNFRRHPSIRIMEFPSSPLATERKRDWRRMYRYQRFSSYFSDAVPRTLSLHGMGVHGRMPDSFRDEAWHNLLIALCDPEMMVIALGLVERLDLAKGEIVFRAPPHDPSLVASVHVGSIQVDLSVPPGRAVPDTRHPIAPYTSAPRGGDPAPRAPVPPASGEGGDQGRSVPDQSG
jgi:polynucleotide 5'-hydroxyl-kinase GRC3/NOL9